MVPPRPDFEPLTVSLTPDEGADAEASSAAIYETLPEGIDFVESVEWHGSRGVLIVVWPMRLHVHTQGCFRA